MIITTEMMDDAGAVTYQMNIMDDLGGQLDTDNMISIKLAIDAGLDLMWLVKKFGSDPTLAPQIEAARKEVQDTATGIINAAIAVYDGALTAYAAALATIGALDPQPIVNIAIKQAINAIPNAAKLAEAIVFTGCFDD